MPERKRSKIVDGGYRIVFNNKNQSQYHNKTNIRDKSIDNVHGDANFPQHNSRTPNINVSTKFDSNNLGNTH